ncbi:MAG TPA: tetratricopeptide repeat protein [Longimicrobiales bacterium]|nr:tetratricopeptide repeat protein [Longimicrobiales bacterium]
MTQPRRLSVFLSELQRRRVFHIAGGYCVVSWLAIQVADTTFPHFGLPSTAVGIVIALAAAGLPVALVVAWVYELTPDGLRRDAADTPATARDIRIWGVAFLVAALLLLVGFGIGSRFGRTITAAPPAETAAAAPGVAVLPFDIVGRDLDLWPEGIVYLLSFNLDGLEGLRKIDPGVVLTNWDRSNIAGPVTPRIARDMARAVGATYVVTGNVVRTGSGVRLTAEVHDASTGAVQGSVSVDEAVDSIQLIVDRLTVALLGSGLLPSEPGFQAANVGGLTSTSLSALKAYLAGEWHFRRSQFREAAADFRDAVTIDSTFARAHYRMAGASEWLEEFADVARHSEMAMRHADRLGARDQLLIRGSTARGPEAIGILEDLTRRYPDDVDGWYQLGEAYFHYGGQSFYAASAYRDAWETALQWGRPYGESYQHLIEDAFATHDSARAGQLIRQMESIDSEIEICPGFGLVFALTWGDDATRARAAADVETVPYDAIECAWTALAAAPSAFERVEEDERALLDVRTDRAVRSRALWRNLQPRLFRGQLHAARELLAQAEPLPLTGDEAARFRIMMHVSGHRDSADAHAAAQRIGSKPVPLDHFWIAALAGSEARWDDVDQAVRALEAQVVAFETDVAALPADPGLRVLQSPAHARAFAAALRAWRDLRTGRTSDRSDLENALADMPGAGYRWEQPQQYLRYDVGLMLLDQRDLTAAQRYLASFYPYDYFYYAPAQYHLGVIHEARAEHDEARTFYQRFVWWWQDCDPELIDRRRQAEDALIRLAGVGD